MRWAGFRKVRRQVCKRISKRTSELGLGDTGAYRTYLASHADEWRTLDSLCRVTISRFYRDRAVFDGLREHVLPRVASVAAERGASSARCWSAGCGSGEEAYTMQIIWQADDSKGGNPLPLEVVATDTDARLLERARTGSYPRSSTRDLPPDLLATAFAARAGKFEILARFKKDVTFLLQDIREETPDGRFDVVLCRNLSFTYFDDELQVSVLDSIRQRLLPGGVLVVGVHESIPPGCGGLDRLPQVVGVYTAGAPRPNSQSGSAA
jgi:chemotaxis protein methyltransferase CheR